MAFLLLLSLSLSFVDAGWYDSELRIVKPRQAPSSCPSANGTTITDSNSVQYDIYCGADTTGNSAGSSSTTNSYEECMTACDVTTGCVAFTWVGLGGAQNGTGSGNCYFKGPQKPTFTIPPGGLDDTYVAAIARNPISPTALSCTDPGQTSYISPTGGNYTIECGTDTDGADATGGNGGGQLVNSGFQDCATLCDETYNCYAFTYTSSTPSNSTGLGTCYMKKPSQCGGVVSFVNAGHYGAQYESGLRSGMGAATNYQPATGNNTATATTSTGPAPTCQVSVAPTVNTGNNVYDARCNSDTSGGSSLATFGRNSYTDCFADCDDTYGCIGFTYWANYDGTCPGNCYLKTNATDSLLMFTPPATFEYLISALIPGAPGVYDPGVETTTTITTTTASFTSSSVGLSSSSSASLLSSSAGLSTSSSAAVETTTTITTTTASPASSNVGLSSSSPASLPVVTSTSVVFVAPVPSPTSTTSSSSASSSAAATGVCLPGIDGSNSYSDAQNVQYAVRCGNDLSGGSIGGSAGSTTNSWTECLPLCDQNPLCTGVVWLGVSPATNGTGTGNCYLHSGATQFDLTGGYNSAKVAAIRASSLGTSMSPPLSSSSVAVSSSAVVVLPPVTTTTTTTTSSNPSVVLPPTTTTTTISSPMIVLPPVPTTATTTTSTSSESVSTYTSMIVLPSIYPSGTSSTGTFTSTPASSPISSPSSSIASSVSSASIGISSTSLSSSAVIPLVSIPTSSTLSSASSPFISLPITPPSPFSSSSSSSSGVGPVSSSTAPSPPNGSLSMSSSVVSLSSSTSVVPPGSSPNPPPGSPSSASSFSSVGVSFTGAPRSGAYSTATTTTTQPPVSSVPISSLPVSSSPSGSLVSSPVDPGSMPTGSSSRSSSTLGPPSSPHGGGPTTPGSNTTPATPSSNPTMSPPNLTTSNNATMGMSTSWGMSTYWNPSLSATCTRKTTVMPIYS